MVVQEMKLSNGVTVRIHDDCYRDITPEERRRRLDRINEVGRRIMESQEREEEERRVARG